MTTVLKPISREEGTLLCAYCNDNTVLLDMSVSARYKYANVAGNAALDKLGALEGPTQKRECGTRMGEKQ